MMHRRSVGAILLSAGLLVGCAVNPVFNFRYRQLATLPPYASAKAKLPPLPDKGIRIYFYRTSTLMLGAANDLLAIVNGRPMGNPTSRFDENLLLPETVFVVDSPQDTVRIAWVQDARPESVDAPIELHAVTGRAFYVRWTGKTGYAVLEQVDELKAVAELESLHFSGYVKLP
jgi:hypothetical protein